MKVLVIGKGGLAWKAAQSFYVDELFCFPGNAGIAKVAKIPEIADDSVESLLDFALREEIDLTIVGPEEYLAKGIVDAFEAKDCAFSASTGMLRALNRARLSRKRS